MLVRPLGDHLVVIDESRFGQATKRYRIENRNDGSHLGTLRFDGGWRRFVFEVASDCKHDSRCLRTIADELDRLTDAWRKRGPSEG